MKTSYCVHKIVHYPNLIVNEWRVFSVDTQVFITDTKTGASLKNNGDRILYLIYNDQLFRNRYIKELNLGKYFNGDKDLLCSVLKRKVRHEV